MAKQNYKVVGSREVDGHAPGSVFSADIEPEREQRLVDAGHLAKSTAEPKEADSSPTAAMAVAEQDAANTAAKAAGKAGN